MEYNQVLPCKVVIETCKYIKGGKIMKNMFKKTKTQKKTKYKRERQYKKIVAPTFVTPNDTVNCNVQVPQEKNIVKKVIFKKMGDKIIAVICNSVNYHKETTSDMVNLHDNILNGGQISVGTKMGPVSSDQSPENIPVVDFDSPSTSYTVTSFGKNPNKRQFYVNDVALCNGLNTPLTKPQAERQTDPTASPMLNHKLDISTNLFQGDIQDIQTPPSATLQNPKRTFANTQYDDEDLLPNESFVDKENAVENNDHTTQFDGEDLSHMEDQIAISNYDSSESACNSATVPFHNSTTVPMGTSTTNMFAASSIFNKLTESDQKAEIDATLFRVAESLLLLAESDCNSKFCVGCKKAVSGVCSLHGNPMDNLPKTKAVLSLPATMSIQTSSLPDAGLGVFSLVVFEIGSLFGPMDGEKLSHRQHRQRGNNPYVWEVYQEDRSSVSHYLDCMNQERSNWMRFVNCARFEEEQNLIAEQYDQLLFYKAYKKILPGQELLAWYGNSYGRELREEFNFPINTLPIGGDDEYGVVIKEEVELQFEDITPTDVSEIRHIAKKPENSYVDNISESVVPMGQETFHECKLCNALFSSSDFLERHHRLCVLASQFRCDECAKLFKSLSTLQVHKRRGHNISKRFKCILCSATFTAKSNLTVHLRCHLNLKKFSCDECGKNFSRGTFLRNHISTVHKKERPYVCNICYKRFCRKDTLNRHSLLHGTEKPYHCSLCGGSYHTADHLKRHVKTGHPLMKNMTRGKCSRCNETFEDIIGHNHYIHNFKISEKCPVCDKAILQVNLRSHMKLHSNPRKIESECPICGEFFKTLNGHMKQHKNQK